MSSLIPTTYNAVCSDVEHNPTWVRVSNVTSVLWDESVNLHGVPMYCLHCFNPECASSQRLVLLNTQQFSVNPAGNLSMLNVTDTCFCLVCSLHTPLFMLLLLKFFAVIYIQNYLTESSSCSCGPWNWSHTFCCRFTLSTENRPLTLCSFHRNNEKVKFFTGSITVCCNISQSLTISQSLLQYITLCYTISQSSLRASWIGHSAHVDESLHTDWSALSFKGASLFSDPKPLTLTFT